MYEDLRRRVVRLYPPDVTINAKLPDWLSDGDEIVFDEDEEIIKPSGFLALQEDGCVKWED